MKIAESVEELRKALVWTEEATVLGDPECEWYPDDTRGWLRMWPVTVDWNRDPYGDGQEDWVAVNVSVDGEPFDHDWYPHLDDAVKDAVHTTAAWQQWRANDMRDEVVSWLENRGEAYDIDESSE